MPSTAEQEDTLEARLAEARKVAQYSYLLPPPSAALLARMRSGQNAPAEEAASQAESSPAPQSAEGMAAHRSRRWAPIDAATARDKAFGCLLGLAVGDAVGTAVEFAARGSFPPLTDMIGGGPFKLRPGEWTDDTTMSLCLAESLLADESLDALDLMNRFRAWLEKGENTVPGKCFDIGSTTRAAIERFIADGKPFAGSQLVTSAGNASLVRLAPLAILYRHRPDDALLLAMGQSRTTHAAQECVDACKLFTAELIDALNGADKETALRQRMMALSPRVLFISAGEFKEKSRDQILSSGYVVHTLEAALWSVWTTDNFRDAVLAAANLGDDADSVGAVAGQLAGALYGASGIPQEWLAKLAWREKIEKLAKELFDRGRGT